MSKKMKWAVTEAVYLTVDAAVRRAVDWAVDFVVVETVYWAVRRAVDEDSNPPGLQDFLREVGG
jgi:hypothetical protein